MRLRPIKVYTASKLRHASLIKSKQADGFHFNARWLDTALLASNATKPVRHWLQENLDDIDAADYVLVYAEQGEHLRTALLEVGWGLKGDKPVLCIGQQVKPELAGDPSTVYHEDYGDWAHFAPQIMRVPTFEQALTMIKRAVYGPDERIEVRGPR